MFKLGKLHLCFAIAYTIALCGCGGSSGVPEILYATGNNQILEFKIDTLTGAINGPTVTPSASVGFSFSPILAATDPAKYLFTYDAANSQINAYSVDPITGNLTTISGSPFSVGSSGGGLPLLGGSLTLAPNGNFVYITGSNGGTSISAFSVDSTSGSLMAVPGSPVPDANGPVSMTINPSGSFAYVLNLDGTISAFAINASTGALSPISGSPFSQTGPSSLTSLFQQIIVDRSGKFLYVPNGSSINAWKIDTATGVLTGVPGSPFAAINSGDTIWNIAADLQSKFLYASSSLQPSIVVLAIDPSSGALSPASSSPISIPVQAGTIVVDPSGKLLCAIEAATVQTFKINSANGQIQLANSLRLPPSGVQTAPSTIVVVKKP